ncbi:MAG: hypothetical protein AMK75_05760 [Planctomycetes bacterium SM23_65]|nr:MAG: hypothetical protein AMK75_05760 [Planctomycetes bacterium SM23_65]
MPQIALDHPCLTVPAIAVAVSLDAMTAAPLPGWVSNRKSGAEERAQHGCLTEHKDDTNGRSR